MDALKVGDEEKVLLPSRMRGLGRKKGNGSDW